MKKEKSNYASILHIFKAYGGNYSESFHSHLFYSSNFILQGAVYQKNLLLIVNVPATLQHIQIVTFSLLECPLKVPQPCLSREEGKSFTSCFLLGFKRSSGLKIYIQTLLPLLST